MPYRKVSPCGICLIILDGHRQQLTRQEVQPSRIVLLQCFGFELKGFGHWGHSA